MKTTKWLLALAVLVSGACDFDIANPNSPDPLGTNPTREQIQGAVTGLLVGSRIDYADWVLEAGIVGREAYRFDASDPRWADELLVGPFDPGNIRFGGDHWLEQYRNIRAAYNLLNATQASTVLSAGELAGLRGFVKTLQALDFMMVLSAHGQDAIPIAVDQDPVGEPPAPFAGNEAAWTFVDMLLDEALTLLSTFGAAFPFQPTSGFTGFNSPSTFARFNRALKARAGVYRGSLGQAACGAGGATCYDAALTALAASFLDVNAPLDRGVYHVYGTGSGDVGNPLFQDTATVPIQRVHPSIRTDAETNSLGQRDRRYATKVAQTSSLSFGDPPRSSDLVWIRYRSNIDPVPVIRNEELLLLRAEARLAATSPDLPGALADVNFVRQNAGGLDPIDLPTWTALTAAQRVDRILKERRYSLLFEGGHRWVDARRTNRLGQLPLDLPGDVAHQRWPVPLDACLARGIATTQCP
jgi:hypothetical protein